MNKHIKEGNFGRLYLFYGSEEYLKDFYINGITDAVLHGDTLNYITFDGKIIADKLRNAWETIPMFGYRLVILVRNSGIFKTQGIKNEDYVFLESLPEDICVIFRENEADKRSKLYKTIDGLGIVFECVRQNEMMIGKILARHADKYGCRISKEAVSLLVAGIGNDLLRLIGEVNKLVLCAGEGGEIDENMVRDVCTLSITATIFNLTDSLADNDKERAYKFLQTLLDDRTEPRFIFTMISNNYTKLYDAKQLIDAGANQFELSSKMGVVDFVAKKLYRQCKAYSLASLREKIDLCSKLDMDSKSGRINEITALNILIGG